MDIKRRKFLSLLGLAGSAVIPAEIGQAQSNNSVNPTIDVRQYGAKGDGVTDDTEFVKNAIKALAGQHGGTLLFPAIPRPQGLDPKRLWGYVLKGLVINADNITLDGAGTLIVTRCITLKCSNFTARNLKLVAPRDYDQENRGFQCITNGNSGTGQTPPAFSNLTFENLQFEGFFYSTNMKAIDYSDPRNDTDGTISEIIIRNCISRAPSGKDAGHFQHIGVKNVILTGNRTFGGQMASSYNFINSNGTITVANNYDENNSYSSCEIENNSNHTIISGNQFGNNIWVDDSQDVIVSGNIAKRINITIESYKCDTLSIVNNHCESIWLHRFSDHPQGRIKNVNIQSNIMRHQETTPRSWAILVQHVDDAIIARNLMIGGPDKYKAAIEMDHFSNVFISENMTQGSGLLISDVPTRVSSMTPSQLYPGTRDSVGL